jgi:hypothetical protein
MNWSKTMQKNTKTRIALVATLLVAGLSGAGVAAAQAAPSDAKDTKQTTSASPSTSARAVDVEHQSGIVIEASGALGDLAASVTVYENSAHGNSVQVVLGDEQIGHAEQTPALVVDGVLQVSVKVDGKDATLRGTITPTGRPEKLTEPIQDAGEQIVTKGTHTQLVGDITLSYDGVVIPLTLDTAFAYDLEVRKVSLYGT